MSCLQTVWTFWNLVVLDCSKSPVPLPLLLFVLFCLSCLFVYLVFYIPATMFPYLQFGLNVGLVGVTYCAITLAYAVGTILTGPITDRLVRYRRSGNFHVKNNSRENFRVVKFSRFRSICENFFNGWRLQYGRALGEFLAFSLLPGTRKVRDRSL